MAILGELWTALEQVNANNIRKWLYGTLLVRDWDPAGTTQLANFNPFLSDGSLRTDLFNANFPGGPWFDAGAIDANGVDFNPRFKTVDTDIWQSRLPQRTDIDSDGEDVDVTFAETNPVALALHNNNPLVAVPGTGAVAQIGAVGQQNFSVIKAPTPQIIFRQLLIIGVDGELANPIYVCEIRPRVSITKMNKRQFNAKRADDFGISFGTYLDPASGFSQKAIYGGQGWTQLGGSPILPIPDYISLAPATLNTATIVPSTLAGVPSGSGGTFAAGTYYWTMTALTAAGESTKSNEITATLSGSTSSNALSWTQVQGATGYKIYRGTSVGGENALITTIGSGATVTYTDTGTAGTAGQTPSIVNNATITPAVGLGAAGSASGGTLATGTYYWVIDALTANGETTRSNEVNAALTGPTASCTLTWTADAGATGYRIYRGSTATGEQYLAGYVSSGATTSFVDTGASVCATVMASPAHSVQLNWQQPTSLNGPFTYSVTQTTGGNTANSTTVNAPVTSTTGLVTATYGSLTASNVYTFTVTVTASDGLTAVYPASNAITAT